jgi:hypothetical protein
VLGLEEISAASVRWKDRGQVVTPE